MGRQAGWPAGWLAGCPAGWLGWLVSWLAGLAPLPPLAGWLVGWLPQGLVFLLKSTDLIRKWDPEPPNPPASRPEDPSSEPTIAHPPNQFIHPIHANWKAWMDQESRMDWNASNPSNPGLETFEVI